METQRKINIPNHLIDLAELLKDKAPLYIVGGYVRNSLLGIGGTDIDLASSITPDELKELLDGTKFILREKSKKLGTLEILVGDGSCYEYSTFRKEVYQSGSGQHTPISVEFTKDIREDAMRRDFSINAIYYDILKDSFIDIYSGEYDIQKRTIKCIETPEYVFENDGVRILRMIRFACELNFKIDWTTFVIAKKMSYRLRDISNSRKYEELTKILSSPYKYEISKKDAYIKGLRIFNKFSLWSHYGVPKSKVKYYMVKKADKSLRFVGLLIDIVNSANPDCVEYYLDFLLGAKGYGIPSKKMANIINIVCGYFDALNKVSNKKYFSKYFNNFAQISELLRVSAKFIHNSYMFFYRYIINHKIPIMVKDLKVDGNDIKKLFPKLPEKKYSKILNDLLSKVFEGELENNKEELIKEIKHNVTSGNY